MTTTTMISTSRMSPPPMYTLDGDGQGQEGETRADDAELGVGINAFDRQEHNRRDHEEHEGEHAADQAAGAAGELVSGLYGHQCPPLNPVSAVTTGPAICPTTVGANGSG